MEYISLILSIGILFFVIQLMFFQQRFDWLNGITITAALIVVLLDLDTIISGRNYEISTFINFAVIALWFINTRREPLSTQS